MSKWKILQESRPASSLSPLIILNEIQKQHLVVELRQNLLQDNGIPLEARQAWGQESFFTIRFPILASFVEAGLAWHLSESARPKIPLMSEVTRSIGTRTRARRRWKSSRTSRRWLLSVLALVLIPFNISHRTLRGHLVSSAYF